MEKQFEEVNKTCKGDWERLRDETKVADKMCRFPALLSGILLKIHKKNIIPRVAKSTADCAQCKFLFQTTLKGAREKIKFYLFQ